MSVHWTPFRSAAQRRADRRRAWLLAADIFVIGATIHGCALLLVMLLRTIFVLSGSWS